MKITPKDNIRTEMEVLTYAMQKHGLGHIKKHKTSGMGFFDCNPQKNGKWKCNPSGNKEIENIDSVFLIGQYKDNKAKVFSKTDNTESRVEFEYFGKMKKGVKCIVGQDDRNKKIMICGTIEDFDYNYAPSYGVEM